MDYSIVSYRLSLLEEIDKIILDDSKRRLRTGNSDFFMSLVHQKEGLIEAIVQETGRKPHWTINGYELS